MNVYVKQYYDDDFASEVVSKYVALRMYSHRKEPQYAKIDRELRERYGVTMKELIDFVSSSDLRCGEINGFVRIGAPSNLSLKGNGLGEMLRFVDDGAFDVKGTKLFSKALTDLKDNANLLHDAYAMGALGQIGMR